MVSSIIPYSAFLAEQIRIAAMAFEDHFQAYLASPKIEARPYHINGPLHVFIEETPSSMIGGSAWRGSDWRNPHDTPLAIIQCPDDWTLLDIKPDDDQLAIVWATFLHEIGHIVLGLHNGEKWRVESAPIAHSATMAREAMCWMFAAKYWDVLPHEYEFPHENALWALSTYHDELSSWTDRPL